MIGDQLISRMKTCSQSEFKKLPIAGQEASIGDRSSYEVLAGQRTRPTTRRSTRPPTTANNAPSPQFGPPDYPSSDSSSRGSESDLEYLEPITMQLNYNNSIREFAGKAAQQRRKRASTNT